MSYATNITPPSHLALISELSKLKKKTKVRVLGCVESYDAAKTSLLLTSRHPNHSVRNAVRVDVSNVLDSIDKELTRTGTWVNVIGYVTDSGCDDASYSPDGEFTPGQKGHPQMLNKSNCRQTRAPELQAITIWHAGHITRAASESRYSQSLQARRRGMDVLDSARRADASVKDD
ncbi:MAG: hypothetical protein M1831_004000 [Alyxoria varia]|nr:MAG: hypothetical protein M1831_004000 [Alyxoria varia]